jgi:uncharacterized protein (TIRG00374 family)
VALTANSIPGWSTAAGRARSRIPRLLLGASLICLAAWFLGTRRDDLARIENGLLATSPWSWLQALALSVALAVATGGVVRHALRMTDVPLSWPAATRLSSASMFLCTLIPSCGMAGAPLFASDAARRTGAPSAGAAGYFVACIVGRLGLELVVVSSLPLLTSCGIPISLVMIALAIHVASTLSKLAVVGASRRHEGQLVQWIASLRSRIDRTPRPVATACQARQIVERFAAVRWRDRNFRVALASSLAGKLVGGLLLVVSVRAAGGSLNWASGLTIYAAATLVGAASFLPAGLGAADLTIGHALVATGMPPTHAATAVVFYRLFQLWIPLVTGGVLAARIGRAQRLPNDPQPALAVHAPTR